ncbi:MAG: hypothetical protein WD426_02260 [Anditalea sp.]
MRPEIQGLGDLWDREDEIELVSNHIIKPSGKAYIEGNQIMEAIWMSVRVK